MPRTKKTTEMTATEQVEQVSAPEQIAPLDLSFGRVDLNQMVDKINELVKKVNENA